MNSPLTPKEEDRLSQQLFKGLGFEERFESREVILAYRAGATASELVELIAEKRRKLGVESCHSSSSKQAPRRSLWGETSVEKRSAIAAILRS